MEKTTAERGARCSGAREVHGPGRRAAEADRRADTPSEHRLRTRSTSIAPSLVKDYFRDAPLLDFMAPTLKVQQVITPNIVDDVNFTRVPKMDRCMTCHLAIDRAGYEN